MFNVRLAGDNLYGKWLFTWLSLVMSLMVSYIVLSFFPRDTLDEIRDCIESTPENFYTYTCNFTSFFLTVFQSYQDNRRVIMKGCVQ